MAAYTAPVDDMMFLLREVLDAETIFARIPAYAEIDLDTVETVAEQAGRFCADILRPLNLSGDIEGSRLFALTCYGWIWLKSLLAVVQSGATTPFAQLKLAVAAFFADRFLLQVPALAHQIETGSVAILAPHADLF